MKPINDSVIIRPEKEKTSLGNGLVIPDSAREKPQKGVIISLGDKVTELKEGDKVAYGKYAGTVINYNGEELLILRQTDIFFID